MTDRHSNKYDIVITIKIFSTWNSDEGSQQVIDYYAYNEPSKQMQQKSTAIKTCYINNFTSHPSKVL